MKGYSRADRVAGLIQRTLSEILLREVKDPRLEMAVITAVKVSPDLKNARIYFSVPGGETERRQDAAEGFRSAGGFIKRYLGDRLDLRYMPELKFFYDESFDYGARIDKLLKSLEDGNGSDRGASEE